MVNQQNSHVKKVPLCSSEHANVLISGGGGGHLQISITCGVIGDVAHTYSRTGVTGLYILLLGEVFFLVLA